jgi:hypothetical protein
MVSSCLLCELISLKCFCLIVSVEISSWLQLHWHYWSESRTRAPSSSASPSDRSFDEWRHRISNNSEKISVLLRKFRQISNNWENVFSHIFNNLENNSVLFLTIEKMFSVLLRKFRHISNNWEKNVFSQLDNLLSYPSFQSRRKAIFASVSNNWDFSNKRLSFYHYIAVRVICSNRIILIITYFCTFLTCFCHFRT